MNIINGFKYRMACNTVKREMLVVIIFGGFENITIWRRFILAILLEESGLGSNLFSFGGY